MTLPYDLTDHLKADVRQTDDHGIEMRVIQMLGLPPDCGYDHIVLFWAEKDSLFRPTPDPEIHDSEVLLDFRDDVDPRYRAWFEDYCRTAYYSDTPYPWTRLGYTYSAHPPASLSVTSCPYPTGTAPSHADPPGFRGNRVFWAKRFWGNG